jgi:multimeric flavodoxin WrbA
MSVLGIVGSPRKGGNTELYMKLALETCAAEGLTTELIHLADYQVRPCNECMACKSTKNCPIQDDFPVIYAKMLQAQGIILSSPVFFSSATPEIKALIDRAGFLGIAQDRPFERKAGGAFVVGRRAGHNFVFMELLFFFLYHGMIIPGSTYWNVGLGKDVGEVMKDEEGIRTIRNFAKNLSWLIKKLES